MACPIITAFHTLHRSLALLNQARRFEASKLRDQAGANLKLRSTHSGAYLPNSARQCSRGGGGIAISGAGNRAISSRRDIRKRWRSNIGIRTKVYTFKPFEDIFFRQFIVHFVSTLSVTRLHTASQDAEDSLAFELGPAPFVYILEPSTKEDHA